MTITDLSNLDRLQALAEGSVELRINPHLTGRETIQRYLSRTLDMPMVGLPNSMQKLLSELIVADRLVECVINYKGMLRFTERGATTAIAVTRMLELLNRIQTRRANNGS